MALVLHRYEWNWSGAEQEYRRALELNPGSSTRIFYALLLAGLHRVDEAAVEGHRAVDLDPLALFTRHALAIALYVSGRHDEAIAEADAGIELDPRYHAFYWNRGLSLAAIGSHEEAIAAFTEATAIAPANLLSKAFLGYAQGLAGREDTAREILADLERQRADTYVSGALLAHVHLGLGELEPALSRLEEAVDERAVILIYLDTWPAYDPLRADPRFQALLRRMNFPEPAAVE